MTTDFLQIVSDRKFINQEVENGIRREIMAIKGECKVIDTILNRRSVREFTDKPISKEDINTILNAGHWASSGISSPGVLLLFETERLSISSRNVRIIPV